MEYDNRKLIILIGIQITLFITIKGTIGFILIIEDIAENSAEIQNTVLKVDRDRYDAMNKS